MLASVKASLTAVTLPQLPPCELQRQEGEAEGGPIAVRPARASVSSIALKLS
jgi:hypothetical protein